MMEGFGTMNLTYKRQMMVQIVIIVVLSILLVMALGVPVFAQTEIASDTATRRNWKSSSLPDKAFKPRLMQTRQEQPFA
jgi:hypothetical protein